MNDLIASPEVCQIIGIPNQTLSLWVSKGYIAASVGGGHQGAFRYWSRHELVGVKIVQVLRGVKASPKAKDVLGAIAKAEELATDGRNLSEIFGAYNHTIGSFVVISDRRVWLERLASPTSILTVVPIGALIAEIDQSLRELSAVPA